MFNQKSLTIVLLFAIASFVPNLVAAQQPVNLSFAAAPTDSPWYAYAGAFRAAMLEELPPGSTVEVLNTPMSIANAKLLAAQRADIAMSFPPVVSWARQGFGPFDKEVENMRGLVGGMDQYYHRITAQLDSPIKSLADIKRNKMAVNIGTGPQGSLNEYIARLMLEAYGLTYDDIESYGGSVIRTSFNVLRNLFGDGKIDLILGITSNGHTPTAQLSVAPGQKFISLDEGAIVHLERYGFSPATMPAGLFKGQSEPVKGVGFSTSLYARADLPEEYAYAIAKAIMGHREKLQRQFGAMKAWSPKESGKQERLGAPLHPGARKYFEEMGLI